MSGWWLVPAFVVGVWTGVLLLAIVVNRFTDEIGARLADLFDRVRIQARELERREDES